MEWSQLYQNYYYGGGCYKDGEVAQYKDAKPDSIYK